MDTEIVLTGLKPTGSPHLGNYVGMLRPALSMVRERPERLYLFFIADYHALTTVREADAFRRLCLEAAATWLALGLDPDRAVLYRQSDVPEVFELGWLLACVTPKGLMNRAHAYKAAVAENVERGESDPDAGVNMGLFNYPVLMAADILLFGSDLVPVGRDQIQHVEIARDIADRFNGAYADVLKPPEHVVRAAEVAGLDGRKMSASYGNTIPLFAPKEELRRLVFSIRTDSTAADEPKDPDASPVVALYEHFAAEDAIAAMRSRCLSGDITWAEAKQELFEALNDELAGPRCAFGKLMEEPQRVEAVLAEGARKARELARPVLEKARRAVGKSP